MNLECTKLYVFRLYFLHTCFIIPRIAFVSVWFFQKYIACINTTMFRLFKVLWRLISKSPYSFLQRLTCVFFLNLVIYYFYCNIHCVKGVCIRSYFLAFRLTTERYFVFLYSVRMQENMDQKNSEHKHFLRSDSDLEFDIYLTKGLLSCNHTLKK